MNKKKKNTLIIPSLILPNFFFFFFKLPVRAEVKPLEDICREKEIVWPINFDKE